MAPTFFWYDLETTGLDPVVDRPIQFAGLRTDMDLNPIESPVNIFSFLGNDVLPNPEAIMVTGLSMSQLRTSGSNEVEFCQQIMSSFSKSETCVVGYNNLKFDDEFVRQMFYRNFYNPYAREWRNGNSRWDVIDMFRMAYALRPDGIQWPKDDTGSVTFRLEELTRANDIEHSDAHDAVSDVLATINLTKLLRKIQPKLFEFFYALRKKDRIAKTLNLLDKKPVIHVSSLYGSKRSCISIVLPICEHPRNSNGVICCDLSLDPKEMIDSTAKELYQLLFSSLDDRKERPDRMPLLTLYMNRCPVIAPLTSMSDEDAIRLGISISDCHAHALHLDNAVGLVEKIRTVFSERTFPLTDDPDRMLYQGAFFGTQDKDLMEQLHEMQPEQLLELQGQFQDPRLDEMLFRFRARNFPHILSADEQKHWDRYRVDRWEGGKSVKEILEKTKKIQGKSQIPCLVDLVDYIENIIVGVSF
ncbi:MAG: exodeoxyribonuclease I [Gammaproteobacteria bacterium]|uniref:Exodeoxyribonuclease I n=1 Tax=OM182 bacterium TaxID=2510334 RepID=A0A520S4V8_9GAMM|nr:exodeoxyribonuclease I [Gammaproteobacteria bacterium]OUV68307.1 MAG: exodeoxyribonuclease I [Gammaproteobacteria bacterium TMED133]RZO77481.1 MAG: exodeoxyribonuclease I [OM182 bacterium]